MVNVLFPVRKGILYGAKRRMTRTQFLQHRGVLNLKIKWGVIPRMRMLWGNLFRWCNSRVSQNWSGGGMVDADNGFL